MVQVLKKKFKNEKGFTLIELLAVIVILGIIAAIAIPAIGNLIKHTQDKATVAEGIQIIDAAKLYTSQNTPTDASTELKDAQLGSHLDNVKDTGYTVTVTKDATTGKLSYSLTSHPAVALVDGDDSTPSVKDSAASESELLAYK